MPIVPFLGGAAFEPETIRVMSIALEQVCKDLGLSLKDDPATRLVAEKIIQLAQWGIREPETLRALTLKEFRPNSTNGIRCTSQPNWVMTEFPSRRRHLGVAPSR